MRKVDCESLNIPATLLVEDGLDAHVIRMWSKREFTTSRFYQTGFETIVFNKDRTFAIETVLSSVVTLDDEILIAGFGNSLNELERKATQQGIVFHRYNWFTDGWNRLDEVVTANPKISKILIGIDAETEVDDIPVEALLSVAAKRKTGLIVYCETSVDGLNDRFKGAIDFMIGECDCYTKHSFVVARRSKLVQTEGVSRSFHFDLYGYWQWSMRKRNSIIEPMCG
jgi:hypothetical protein